MRTLSFRVCGRVKSLFTDPLRKLGFPDERRQHIMLANIWLSLLLMPECRGFTIMWSQRRLWTSCLVGNPGFGRRTLLRASTESAPLAVLSWREGSKPEKTVPDVSLTRSRDGSTGTATFRFQNPDVLSFNDVWENGLITGLWMKDDEGLLMTRDLDVAFERGSPTAMTAILVLKSTAEWDRFMRFMQRYAESNSLEFERAGS